MSPLAFIPVSIIFLLCAILTFGRFRALGFFREQATGGRFPIALSGLCLSIAYLLLLPPVYAGFESVMPAPNGTDLVSKYFAMLAVALLGGHLGDAYSSPEAKRWAVGAPGTLAFGIAAVSLLACFIFTDAPGMSPQLAAYSDQLSVRFYIWVMLGYVAYVVLPLIKPAYRDARNNPLGIARIASWLVSGGFALSVLRACTFALEATEEEPTYWYMGITYASTVAVVIGLALFAYARRRSEPENKLSRSFLSID